MALAQDRCICLRKFEYSESSQILTLMSREHGLVRVLAKGAHRRTKAGASRFDGGADLLDSGQAVFMADSAKELALLTEWKLTDGHLELRQDLRGLYLALYAAELIGSLFEEHDAHPAVFDRAESALVELGTGQREEAFLAFELELLKEAGFSPQLDGCVACGAAGSERETVYFSPGRGGMVCQNCQGEAGDRFSVDWRLLRLLRAMQAGGAARLPKLTRHQTDPLNHLLALHIEHALGKRLRMPEYVLFEGGTRARGVAGGSAAQV